MNAIADTDPDNINVQLPLGLSLRDSARFESFYSGPNREVKQALRRCAEGSERGPVFIWGAPGTGKTHLLHWVYQTPAQARRKVVESHTEIRRRTVRRRNEDYAPLL